MKTSLLFLALLAPAMASTFGKFPLRFEERDAAAGQYISRGPGYAIRLHPAGADLRTAASEVSVILLGANPKAAAKPMEVLAAHSNYFIGSDARQWKSNLRNFARVRYSQVYPGIDLDYYGHGDSLEYDFLVAPGGDPNAIRMQFSRVRITAAGDLEMTDGIVWRKPVAYQNLHGNRQPVPAEFVQLAENRIGFRTGAYDHTQPLIIDPVLQYATYLGGSGADEANAIAADAAGNTYITGFTKSIDFPTKPGVFQPVPQGSQDAFIVKISPNGSAILYATFIGGNGTDTALGIAIDAQGNAYITGRTESTNFPVTTGAFQMTLSGGNGIGDAFALKLDPTGGKLVYSTYLGGSLDEQGNSIAVDKSGSAYVAGWTQSLNFPQVNAVGPVRGGTDAFVAKLSTDGTKLIYATYLGGFARDVANGVAVDSSGAAYVTGETRSDNFPVSALAFQKTLNGTSDAFLTKLSADGTSIVYSTYFGGESTEDARGVAVDSTGAAWITGQTASAGLPVLGNAIQRASGFLPDAYAARFGPSGQFLQFSSYIGAEGDEAGNAVAVDAFDNAVIVGQTNSQGFPIASGLGGSIIFNGNTFPFPNAGGWDGFVLKFNANGIAPIYESCFGGKGDDYARGVAIDGSGNVYITGSTTSKDLRTAGSLQTTFGGGDTDGFVARISEISVSITPTSANLGPSQTLQFNATVMNTANTNVVWSINPAVGTISNTGLYTAPATAITSTTVTVTVTSVIDNSKSASATIIVGPPVSVTVTPATVTLGQSQTQQFTANVTGASNTLVNWSITPQLGTISGAGLYTSPASIPVAGAVTVTATSVADGSRSASAQVTLQPPVPAVIVITPVTIAMRAGQKQQFSAAATGLASAAVTWSISPQTGTIDPTGLYTAPYPALATQAITVTARSTVDSTVTGTATISLAASGAQISSEGVTNAANFQSAAAMGGISPGLIVTVFGTEIGPAQLAGLQLTSSGTRVDTIAGGTRVLFDGVAAPMIYALSGQVSCVAPYALAGKISTQVQAEYNGQRSNAVTVPVQAASPAVFTADSSGKGQGSILNQDNSVNSAANPAAAGSVVVIYATGAGQTNPAGVDGAIIGVPLPVLVQAPKVSIGGVDAEVLYAGPAPGLVAGVLQINAKIPAGLSGSSSAIKINFGTATTLTTATVSIK